MIVVDVENNDMKQKFQLAKQLFKYALNYFQVGYNYNRQSSTRCCISLNKNEIVDEEILKCTCSRNQDD